MSEPKGQFQVLEYDSSVALAEVCLWHYVGIKFSRSH